MVWFHRNRINQLGYGIGGLSLPGKLARNPKSDNAFGHISHSTRSNIAFNLLETMPSLRADQMGKIGMILVHNNGEKCPPDAPVVHVVDISAKAPHLTIPLAPFNSKASFTQPNNISFQVSRKRSYLSSYCVFQFDVHSRRKVSVL